MTESQAHRPTTNLPADVVGVIVEFACTSLPEAAGLMRVNSMWQQGVDSCEPLWWNLMKQVWPESKARAGKKSILKARLQLARGKLDPIPKEQLRPIENCSMEFVCPMFAENHLRPLSHKEITEQGLETGNPVFHCGLCKEHVFVVKSQQECDQRASEGRCIMYDAADYVPTADVPQAVVAIMSLDRDRTLRFILAIKQAILNDGSLEYSGSSVSIGGSDFVWRARHRPTVNIQFVLVEVDPETREPVLGEGSPAQNAALFFVMKPIISNTTDTTTAPADVAAFKPKRGPATTIHRGMAKPRDVLRRIDKDYPQRIIKMRGKRRPMPAPTPLPPAAPPTSSSH